MECFIFLGLSEPLDLRTVNTTTKDDDTEEQNDVKERVKKEEKDNVNDVHMKISALQFLNQAFRYSQTPRKIFHLRRKTYIIKILSPNPCKKTIYI